MSSAFSVNVIDACRPPVELIAPILIDQYYTIGENAVVIQLPQWSADPAYCVDRLVFSPQTLIQGQAGPAVIFDGATITIHYIADVVLAGIHPEGITHNVSINVSLYSATSILSFGVNFRNPCLDPDHISLNADGKVSDFEYVIGYQQSWTHEPFTVIANNAVQALCGPIKYTATMGVISGFGYYDPS